MTLSFDLLAQAAPGGGGLGMLFPLLIMVAMMYFLVIRPQSKQRKELANRIAALKKGDKVITTAGIHASVHHIGEKTITLKLSEGVFVPFEKNAIATAESKPSVKEEAKEASDESKS